MSASAAPMVPSETAQLRANSPARPPDAVIIMVDVHSPWVADRPFLTNYASSNANLPRGSGVRPGTDRCAQVIRIHGPYLASVDLLDRSTRGGLAGRVASQLRRSLVRELGCCCEACAYSGPSCTVLLLQSANWEPLDLFHRNRNKFTDRRIYPLESLSSSGVVAIAQTASGLLPATRSILVVVGRNLAVASLTRAISIEPVYLPVEMCEESEVSELSLLLH
jgi:hypothetical protein